MVKEKISLEFRFKNIDETKNYFVEAKEQNELISNKHKKLCTTLNYIEHFLVLASTVTGCISISTFVFLLGVPTGITSSTNGLKICATTAGLKSSTLRSQITVFPVYCFFFRESFWQARSYQEVPPSPIHRLLTAHFL